MEKESFVINKTDTGHDSTQVVLEGQLVIRKAAIIKGSRLINSKFTTLIKGCSGLGSPMNWWYSLIV
ncbi:MAG: hypothetical protein M3Z92_10500 [Bacteroidota bacterium]|nr:hypothetical protein [Bacteroidota bacterium]